MNWLALLNMLINKILHFNYSGLRKVISGGQCGSDRGGLEVARDFKIETGGTAPKGWRTHYGPAPELAEFGLVEHHSPEYGFRTEINVAESDATIIVASDLESPGVSLTRRVCHKLNKPFFTVRPADGVDTRSITKFIIKHQVEVLNIAGNRDKQRSSTFHRDFTYDIMETVFLELRDMGKLITKS